MKVSLAAIMIFGIAFATWFSTPRSADSAGQSQSAPPAGQDFVCNQEHAGRALNAVHFEQLAPDGKIVLKLDCGGGKFIAQWIRYN